MTATPAVTTQGRTETLYQERLKRYTTALRNGKPDRVPIRPFVAEFTAKYCGMDCQQVTQNYELAFDAALRTAGELGWDAAVANMVYLWGAISQVLGTRYYAVPGVNLDRDTGFQYLEPSEDDSFMQPDEYDALIADPTGFLLNVWIPRTNKRVSGPGQKATEAGNLAMLKAGIAVYKYFNAFPAQAQRMRREAGVVSAISGILKAPLDILADKLRGYVGLTMDLFERPDKVLAACEALSPHLLHTALSGADPDRNVPISIWMHRGCVPFVNPEQFQRFYWATLKPIVEAIWAQGVQTLFYAEGKWAYHWDAFLELPAGSIIYHCDRDDPIAARRKLGSKFAISGGVPNELLSYGTPEQVRARVRQVIDGAARDGGFIMDASAIVQNDATVENIVAMTEATLEFGQY